ncbi:MAG: hypothetical protein JRH01_07700 [Deltaproteobacteria bacterium]|nr:hypothetical protein [Deltaproteobacteria bacterium]MBW2395459.1 hypothetical protein [Deltaproteobacteria bacterium]
MEWSESWQGKRLIRFFRLAVASALLLVVGIAPFSAAAQDTADETSPRIYRWIDENGIAHYTTERERIPAALRNRVGRLGGEKPARTTYGGPSDAWAGRDRAVTVDPDGWYEAGDTVYVDPAVVAEQAEEQAIALFDLDLRISELEIVIREDEDALKSMVSDPNSGGPLASGENETFKTIAMRLPGRLDELGSLRDQRAALEAQDESAE